MSDYNLKNNIIKFIERYTRISGENSLHAVNERAWGVPIVGFADGRDPLFKELRNHYRKDNMLTPDEIISKTFPDKQFKNGISVIAWALPQNESTLKEQSESDYLPAKRWLLSRLHGENFNKQLKKDLVKFLSLYGIPAAIPEPPQTELKEQKTAEKYSDWSDLYAAYVSGLGTFGLSEGFITEAGIAVRISSIIVGEDIEPTQRTYSGYYDNCLHFSGEECGICIGRCPSGAVSINGHDKHICENYITKITAPHAEIETGFKIFACAMCQSRVPCEKENPVRKKQLRLI